MDKMDKPPSAQWSQPDAAQFVQGDADAEAKGKRVRTADHSDVSGLEETPSSPKRHRAIAGLNVKALDHESDIKVDARKYANATATDEAVLPESFFVPFFKLNTPQYPEYGTALIFLYMDLQHHGQDEQTIKEDMLIPAILRSGADKVFDTVIEGNPQDEAEKPQGYSSPTISDDLADELLRMSKKTGMSADTLDEAVKEVFPEKGEEMIIEFMRLHFEKGYMENITEE